MVEKKDIMTKRAWEHKEEVVNSFQKAVDNNDVDTISKMLIGKDIIINAFEKACENGEIETVKLLIDAGISTMNEDAISYAVSNGRIEIVELFINNGISTEFLKQPFWKAILNGNVKIVDLLLKNGIYHDMQMSTNIKSPGKRALIIATEKGYDEIVNLLIKYGADIYNQHIDREHPLIIAAEKGYTGVVKVLLENGQYLKGDNEYLGKNAMRIAIANDYTEIVELLEKAGERRTKKIVY